MPSDLHGLWGPITAVKGARSGMHSVKWTGPNADGSMRVARLAAAPFCFGPEPSQTPIGAPCLAVSKSESPVGFHVLHLPAIVPPTLSPPNAASAVSSPTTTLSSTPPSPALDAQIHVALFLEPGTIVWSCGPQPNRHALLQELGQIVAMAHLIANTAASSPSASGGEGQLPNHLVIAPHGWPTDAPKKAEQELRDWLFKLEPTFDSTAPQSADADAAERNAIRLTLEAAFLSLQVFAFPEPESLQHRDRMGQCLRSRWIAGCLEGWSIVAATTSAPLQQQSTGGGGGVRFAPVVYAEAERLHRVEHVFRCLENNPMDGGYCPLWSVPALDGWVRDRVEVLIQTDFVQYCGARRNRMTSQQAWAAHDAVLARCKHLSGGNGLTSSPDAALELERHAEAVLDAELQTVLVGVQAAEEARRQSQQQRHALQAQAASSSTSGFLSDVDKAVWFSEHVQRLVPRRYWFWFTTQGLGVAFVFLTLVLYTFWPRGG